jgi:hypothetical protein
VAAAVAREGGAVIAIEEIEMFKYSDILPAQVSKQRTVKSKAMGF